MLKIPTKGIAPHNVKIDVLCDWIEGSLLFIEGEMSKTDVVDALCEDNIYSEQSKASETVDDAWAELRRRYDCCCKGGPITFKGIRIVRNVASWKAAAAYSFCLFLSLKKWYGGWYKVNFGNDYTEQGELFEELTKESLKHQFDGWEIHSTGWTRTRTNKLGDVVEEVATLLGEQKGEVGRWSKPDANEAGLDLLCYRPFLDRRVGVPVYLLQCASGGDWEGKLHTPRLEIWNKIITFAATPRKAFSTPFAFSESDFIRNAGLVDGLLLDRSRLLAAKCHKSNWLPKTLKDRIISWAEPRVAKLPTRDV